MSGTMEMNVLEVGTVWRSLVSVCLLPYQICRPSARTLHVAVYDQQVWTLSYTGRRT